MSELNLKENEYISTRAFALAGRKEQKIEEDNWSRNLGDLHKVCALATCWTWVSTTVSKLTNGLVRAGRVKTLKHVLPDFALMSIGHQKAEGHYQSSNQLLIREWATRELLASHSRITHSLAKPTSAGTSEDQCRLGLPAHTV